MIATWTLIILLSNFGGRETIVENVPGFADKAACYAAAGDLKQEVREKDFSDKILTVCVEMK